MQASVSELNGTTCFCYLPLIDNDSVICKSKSVLATLHSAAFQSYSLFSHCTLCSPPPSPNPSSSS